MAVGDLKHVMAQPVNEWRDIQGILRSGYGKLEEASFLLLRIADVVRRKLGSLQL